MEDNNHLIEERKKKIFNFIKKPAVWVIFFLIIALILGIYIRSMPMQDHGGNPGLWDVSTDNWTLGPDLDPWLFVRTATSIINDGSIPEIDTMRNVPLGFNNAKETMVLPYLISYTYKILKLFYSPTTIEFAGAIFPVIMFALTILSFFLFVREIFVRKSQRSKMKANIVSLISTFFMIVIPVFLSRTIAGIPEKESAAFFFMFLTFYLFLKAWKSEKIKTASILSVLAGLSTALMGLIWGGVLFIFISIGGATLVAFILNKIKKKEAIIYGSWIISSLILWSIFSARVSILGSITSLASGLAFFTFLIIIVDFILWNTKLKENKFLNKLKIPKTIISLIITILLVVILSSIFLGPSFLIDKIKVVHQSVFQPTTGRWNTTVAENRQPFFTEWGGSFGPFIKGIPLMFLMFFIGSVFLFKKMLNKLKKKDSWILTICFVLLLLGMIFSRYSGSGVFNGENFISKFVYYGAVLLFLGFLVKIYYSYYKENNLNFEKIRYEYILLFSLFLLAIFSARGAVRLIMVLGPIAPIFVANLNYDLVSKFFKIKEENKKIMWGIFAIIIILLSLFTFWSFYKQIAGNPNNETFFQGFNKKGSQSYNMIPSGYNQQWQKSMDWVRDETPSDSVFGHWWDYGYWVQSIGNRATVLDGGNAITFWNYWMGRLVLTGDNQKDALEFLSAHDTTHFLIDSSDIGKYGAFSGIGSNENYDRYSFMGTMQLDQSQTHETNNVTSYVYSGGTMLDEDIIFEQDGGKLFFPSGKAGIGAVITPFEKVEGGENPMQPQAIIIYQNQQYSIPMRYLSIEGKFIDFNSGINATAFIFPRLENGGQGFSVNGRGAMIYLSPRLMRGMLTQKYILDDPFNNFPNFKITYNQPSLVVESLRAQGMNVPDFVYSGNYCSQTSGICGPIKIWEIEYPVGFVIDEETREKYLDSDSSKYLDWKL